jgi:biopolymer transport protein TolR
MAMAVGGKGGLNADINMTPLIDVLLVLLIIFMVINPPVISGLDALVPQPNPNEQKQPPDSSRTIVIQVEPNNVLRINQESVTEQTLGPRLEEIFKTRAERIAFVKGADNLEFREVAKVIDIAKGAGVDKIGLITAKMEQGQ